MRRGASTSSQGPLEGVGTMRVLAIDDMPANTRLIARILRDAGIHSVTELNDPLQVDRMLSEIDPDLVLLDLRMPGMDGYEALQHVQVHAAGSFLPVVVISADDSNESTTRALDLGAHDVVAKPFDAGELVLRARNLLRTRAAYLELRRSRAWVLARLDMFDAGVPAVDDDPGAVRELISRTIAEDSVQIALQPIVTMDDGDAVGYEALSRFPPSSLAHPGVWYAAAEQLGLAVELEMHAVHKACRLLSGLPSGPPSPSTSRRPRCSPARCRTSVRRWTGRGWSSS
ncbi:MAG TPA: response regulator [Candidatus Nanopelagicales bacterium]|nr:response regulator [Candidatus Nanopelagicales bacterium]